MVVHSTSADAKSLRTETLVLKTVGGEKTFTVEMAETPGQQSTGLMFRTAMASDRGMLFTYKKPQTVSMWMKNTYIPLDMIFIAGDGTVHHIVRNTVPQSLKTIDSNGSVTAVLELNAGTADRIGLKPGDKVVHPHFAK